MKTLVILISIVLALGISAAAQNKSVYTSTSDKICKKLKVADDHGGDYVGMCPGVGGYKIKLIEGDLRQTLYVITPAKKELPLDLIQFYSSFSAVGDKIEWRMKKGSPVALIVRYNVADPENSEKRTSYLMVAKVGKKESCVTDVVMPGSKQNETARKLADAAPAKPCMRPEN